MTACWKRSMASVIRRTGRRDRRTSSALSMKRARSRPSMTWVTDVSGRPSAPATAPDVVRPAAIAASADW